MKRQVLIAGLSGIACAVLAFEFALGQPANAQSIDFNALRNRFGTFLGGQQTGVGDGAYRNGPPPHHNVLKKFDANADGTLDAQERSQAQSFMQERRRMGGFPSGGQAPPNYNAPGFKQQRHNMLMKKFDSNGDGHLDTNEGAQARDFMQQQGASSEAPHAQGNFPNQFNANGYGPPGANQPPYGQPYRNHPRQAPNWHGANGGQMPPPQWSPKQFDQNGDGTLDENEQSAARSFMQQRQAEDTP